ncbi:MAG: alpha/beta hydrolase family protein [Hyphomicrobiales bacterium]
MMSLKTRQEVIQELENLIGSRLKEAAFAPPRLIDQKNYQGWHLDTLHFDGADGETIPALFLHPIDPQTPVPAVLYCHAHGNRFDFGMAELMEGRGSLQGAYGPALQALGLAVLCLEMPAFGARQGRTESERAKKHLWNGTTLFGQMLEELAAGISFLANHRDVDETRIGVLGFSMGSTHAWWLAALDERVKASVALCSFADLDCLTQTPAHDGHGIYMTVLGLLNTFSTGQIAGLAAPRALMIGVGLQDWSTPEACFEKARKELDAAYADAPEALRFHIEPDMGHVETPAMRQASLDFLEAHLCH